MQLVRDQANAVIGGLIADKTVKYTKNDKIMAFLNVEDLIGNVEVVVFPQVYERYSTLLVEDAKVFIRGRVSLEEDKDGKLICDQIISFEDAQAARAANQPLFPEITEAGAAAAAADPTETEVEMAVPVDTGMPGTATDNTKMTV